jgi:hypothetical protein
MISEYEKTFDYERLARYLNAHPEIKNIALQFDNNFSKSL